VCIFPRNKQKKNIEYKGVVVSFFIWVGLLFNFDRRYKGGVGEEALQLSALFRTLSLLPDLAALLLLELLKKKKKIYIYIYI
jgi:hypothetical protein